ncbi:AAA domain-containing protein [Aestuariibacter salexigens]|uniref:AAA domain-containing protein n=1 Tax=Aestuariibacter salexigens TaxID=226010 RepID=UPI0003FD145B|nr:AAA domain-containing protein [Aestuariibacter salexigens]
MQDSSSKATGYEPETQKSWVGAICGYFRDFLDTDFKKTTAPKRSISNRNSANVLTGIPLNKYNSFRDELIKRLSTPFDGSMSVSVNVPRGRYKSRMSKRLLSVIDQHIKSIAIDEFMQVASNAKVAARERVKKFKDDPDGFANSLIDQLQNNLLNLAVNPLLESLDNYFKQMSQSGIESIYNIEEELGANLTAFIDEPISAAVAAAIVDDDFTMLDALIDDACDSDAIKQKLIDYFRAFDSSDLFAELSELRGSLRLIDNSQLYLYLASVRFKNTAYPLLYLPVSVELKESAFHLRADPHLYINKRAVDFLIGEVNRSGEGAVSFALPDRILYASEGESVLGKAQPFIDEFTNALSLNGVIDLKASHAEKASRSSCSVDNAFHFSIFDKGDESLLNDYEELLTSLNSTEALKFDKLAEEFESLIESFMFGESDSFEAEVEADWESMSLTERLVYESPVPLNEEQRKIISGLNKPGCKFISVEGPPGTGKSHSITAAVFDAILRGKNVLVLSDKAEALDVVENKIRQTLSAVRVDDNFQDPILRLGKQGNTYSKILSTKTVEQIKRSSQVAKSNEKRLHEEIEKRSSALTQSLGELESTLTSIDIQKIAEISRNEPDTFAFTDQTPETFLYDVSFCKGMANARALIKFFSEPPVRELTTLLDISFTSEALYDFFDQLEKMLRVIGNLTPPPTFHLFNQFDVKDLQTLADIIDRIQDAELPVFGFLFAKSKLQLVKRKLVNAFNYQGLNEHPRTMIQTLQEAESFFREFCQQCKESGIEVSVQNTILKLMKKRVSADINGLDSAKDAFEALIKRIKVSERTFAEIGLSESDLTALAGNHGDVNAKAIVKLDNHIEACRDIFDCFQRAPNLDYPARRAELEGLQTQKLANIIDERLVTFANESKNKASQIKTIIQKKQKFPKEQFAALKEAFPIIIAGIRDYAEYIPLDEEIFDLIIIDEASQVSIAQALPAFIRAKKVLVLGDKNQFSNVKTENASKAVNQSYKAAVMEQFTKQQNNLDDAKINQIKLFDVKTSVLEFVDRIANLKIMLRKHFRGYPELISFSSKYFYGNQLQAVKIRGKSVNEIIEFCDVEHDGRHELKGNVNVPEADAVIQRLKAIYTSHNGEDVCVITPHNEQQKHLLQSVQSLPEGTELMEKLRLRIFTFDSCQGEEAHTVIYSMVATSQRDRLNYIFAKDLNDAEDVEDNLRLQRLNVGFSRAKERIVIFHSKPIEDFKGGIFHALNHYRAAIDKGLRGPETRDVDPASPMELQVLSWLRELPLLDELGDKVEVDAQFELGAYLRQLDPFYSHPDYKVDFLLKIQDGNRTKQIILEYDGFKEHFTHFNEVNALNYEYYMRPEDIERQKVLESYGYTFVRINRFNIGSDPVKTLDLRLRELLKSARKEPSPPSLVAELQKEQNALENGDSKVCAKCKSVKPLEEFYDENLQGGKGGYGRNCWSCKQAAGATKKKRLKKKDFAATYSAGNNEVGSGPNGWVYLNCPYSDKDECRQLGGKWDPYRKQWYIPSGQDVAKFKKWL